MFFGAHVSIAGGIPHAPLNAHEIGAEIFQMFSRSPRGGKAPDLTRELVSEFKKQCRHFGYERYYIHTPYYINLASADGRIRNSSIAVIREELERATVLGVKAVMTHLGSAKNVGRARAKQMVISGIRAILRGYKGTAQFLIENAAGAGEVIGDSFDEIASIIKGVETDKTLQGEIGVCFDTCHAFASGYDLRDKRSLDKTLKEFDRFVGVGRLKVVHGNDSKKDLGARRDRHENIGKGYINIKGFYEIVHHPKLRNLDLILETPWKEEKTIVEDINILKSLRQGR